MNHERIKTLIDSYGAYIARWPEQERTEAEAMLIASPELITYRDNALALDKLLAPSPVPEDMDTSTLASRIMDNLPEQKQVEQPKNHYVSFATAAAVALVFVSTWLLQPTTTDIPFSEPTEIAQTEFELWAWEETLDQTPMTVAENDEPADEWSFMEI